MNLYTFLILLLILVGVGITASVLRRRWQGYAGETESESDDPRPEAKRRAKLLHATTNGFQGLLERFLPRTSEETLQKFQDWSQVGLSNSPDVQSWLADLPQVAYRQYLDDLILFCGDSGFDLDWLLDQRLTPDAELSEALTQVVAHYSRTYRHAEEAQSAIQRHRRYLDFEQNPYARRQWTFAQTLFDALVQAGQTAELTSEQLLTSGRGRHMIMAQAIQQAATADRSAFNQVLASVLPGEAEQVVDGVSKAAPRVEQMETVEQGVG